MSDHRKPALALPHDVLHRAEGRSAERTDIANWLRNHVHRCSTPGCPTNEFLNELADRIDRGEHTWRIS